MREPLERILFSVVRDGHVWAVEHEGGLHAHSSDKEEAKAWAHKRAREVVDRGGAARVVVSGESALR